MSGLDWLVVGVYLAAMIALSAWLSRGQTNADDYYVGGRNLPWWAVGLSTMATQTSAIGFIGIPAYVALAEGGGLNWLQYELAVPVALIAVMVLLIPLFRKLELISVYEYLELRFDRRTRRFMSGVFLLSRGLGTGVGIYASALVLSVCLSLPVWACILLIGLVTVIYDTLGGMAAVVYSDVIQLAVLVLGLGLCITMAVDHVGSMAVVLAKHDPARLQALSHGTGILDGEKAPLWGFVVGGFFLYASYYGVDQSQAQRELSAPTIQDTKRSLVLNAYARFPLTALYVLLGLSVGAAYHVSEPLRASIPAEHLDQLVPRFVLFALPAGARGILFAAIIAAAMSSLDSALNSLSAATVRDFIEPGMAELPAEERGRKLLRWGKITTVLWGAIMTGFAFLVGGISDTVVQAINLVGSLFYGPLLAAFLSGILDRRSRGAAVIGGVVVGVGVNLVLWQVLGEQLFWMWWNLSGMVVAMLVTGVTSRFMPPPGPEKLRETTLTWAGILENERQSGLTYLALVVYFGLLFFLCANSNAALQTLV